MEERLEKLDALVTTLIDSRHGYEEALNDAGERGLTGLFQEMIAMRTEDIEGLQPVLASGAGEMADPDGSFMATVHRTVISVRSVFSELDEAILPSLISGEERILNTYDEAIAASHADAPEYALLINQRDRLATKIGQMQAMKIAS